MFNHLGNFFEDANKQLAKASGSFIDSLLPVEKKVEEDLNGMWEGLGFNTTLPEPSLAFEPVPEAPPLPEPEAPVIPSDHVVIGTIRPPFARDQESDVMETVPIQEKPSSNPDLFGEATRRIGWIFILALTLSEILILT